MLNDRELHIIEAAIIAAQGIDEGTLAMRMEQGRFCAEISRYRDAKTQLPGKFYYKIATIADEEHPLLQSEADDFETAQKEAEAILDRCCAFDTFAA